MFKNITANLLVKDVDATIAWYKEMFSAEVEASVPYHENEKVLQWASIKIGNSNLMFQLKENFIEEFSVISDYKIGGSLTFFINVENIHVLHEHIKDKVEIVMPMKTTFYGMNEFAIKDLNGYFLCFAEPDLR